MYQSLCPCTICTLRLLKDLGYSTYVGKTGIHIYFIIIIVRVTSILFNVYHNQSHFKFTTNKTGAK